MTKNRRRKASIRAYQAATGTPYTLARRQGTPLTLAEVMQQHPLLNAFGVGVFEPRSKTPEQRRTDPARSRPRAISKYVTNGEFIAGALIAGYTFKYTDGPNVEFGMSARDVKRIRSAAP